MNTDFIDAVRALNLKYPIVEIAEKTKQNNGNVSRYLSGKFVPPIPFIISFCQAYGLNYDKDFKNYIIYKQQTASELISTTDLTDDEVVEEIKKKAKNISKEGYKNDKRTNSRNFFDSILPLVGFKEKGDIGYKELVEELSMVVKAVQNLTGVTIDEISMKLYGKSYTIKNALEGGWISHRMAEFILRKYDFDFEKIKQITKSNSLKSNEENIGKPYFTDITEAELNNFSKDLAFSYINIPYIDVDLFVNVIDSKMPSKYQKDDILGLKKTNKEFIRPNGYFIIHTIDNSFLIKRVKPKNSKSIWVFDDEDDNSLKSEIFLKDIKNIYEIVSLTRL